MHEFRSITVLLVSAGLLAACGYTPTTWEAGGFGRIVDNGKPVVGAEVVANSLNSDALRATTDADGRFDILVDRSKQPYLLMANPGRTSTTIVVSIGGRERRRWEFERKMLGPNYYDFGTVDISTGTPPAPVAQ